MKVAARRHLRGAQELFKSSAAGAQPGCRAIAGYIFGLAGELAVKQMMRESGMRELASTERRDDPFYAHFPKLKALLGERAQGRLHDQLRKIAANPRLFQNWDTDMRYAPTNDILEDWIVAWKKSAEEIVDGMDLS
jgi:hypothetical protein